MYHFMSESPVLTFFLAFLLCSLISKIVGYITKAIGGKYRNFDWKTYWEYRTKKGDD